jgi:hypothetical protein
LWLDPDVRWLTGVHEAGGHSYLVRESYEELLWWLLMPSLLRLANEAVPDRAAIEAMGLTVDEALDSAEAAGYRIDALLASMRCWGLRLKSRRFRLSRSKPERPRRIRG